MLDSNVLLLHSNYFSARHASGNKCWLQFKCLLWVEPKNIFIWSLKSKHTLLTPTNHYSTFAFHRPTHNNLTFFTKYLWFQAILKEGSTMAHCMSSASESEGLQFKPWYRLKIFKNTKSERMLNHIVIQSILWYKHQHNSKQGKALLTTLDRMSLLTGHYR